MSKYGVLSGPYFPVFGLNAERYEVSLRIQSECRKIRIKKSPYLDTFHAVNLRESKLVISHNKRLLLETLGESVLVNNLLEYLYTIKILSEMNLVV